MCSFSKLPKKKKKKTSPHMQWRRSYLLKLFIKLILAELTLRSHVIVYTNVQSALGERKQREGFFSLCAQMDSGDVIKPSANLGTA